MEIKLTPENAASDQLEFCCDNEAVATFTKADGDTLAGIVTGTGDGVATVYVKYPDKVISNKVEVKVEDKAKKEALQKEGESVTKLIDTIGAVTLESESAIQKVRKAYDSMSAEAKPLVKNLSVLTDAEQAYTDLREKADQAKPVEEAISLIGEVSLESEPVILEAREKYDALPDDVKEMVPNYSTLTDAETSCQAQKEKANRQAEEAAQAEEAGQSEQGSQSGEQTPAGIQGEETYQPVRPVCRYVWMPFSVGMSTVTTSYRLFDLDTREIVAQYFIETGELIIEGEIDWDELERIGPPC